MSGPLTGENPPWLVRIWRAEAVRNDPQVRTWKPCGAGVLCTDRHVMTCAHVLDPKLGAQTPDMPLRVEFEFVPGEPVYCARPLVTWRPARDEDLAVLELEGELPAGAGVAPLCSDIGGVRGHGFLAYGYPVGYETAVPSTGTIQASGHTLSLTVGFQQGLKLERGFSGTAVWDVDLQAVVGVVVERALPRHENDRLGDQDSGTGFAIPVRRIAQWWPPLLPHVRTPSDEELRRQLDELTELPLAADGALPRVGGTDMYNLGVARSTRSGVNDTVAPYVPRGVDHGLDAALAAEPFVLAVGPSAAGKSRSMIEALGRTWPDAALVVPVATPDAVRQLARLLPADPRGTVVWLDDLHRFLGPQGLRLTDLDELGKLDPPVRIAAAMTSQHYAERRAEGELGRAMRSVLARAHVIRMDRELSDQDELTAANRAYPEFTEADLRTRGIGALLVAAAELDALYIEEKEVDPPGWAVLQAVIDWRRIGLETPVPEPTLRVLFADYLDDTLVPNADHAALFGPALDRVLTPVRGNVAAVSRIERDGLRAFRAYDYLKELADADRPGVPARPVPPVLWDRAVDSVAAAQLLDLALGAIAGGRMSTATRVLERARAQQADTHISAWGTVLLGEFHLNAADGDKALGRDLLRDAIASGFADVVGIGQVDLGADRLTQGDLAGATALLEAALSTDDPGVRLLAKANLGVVRQQEGNIEAALALYEEVIAAEESETAELAGVRASQALLRPAAQQKSAEPNEVRLGRGQLSRVAAGSTVLAVRLAQTNIGGLLLHGEPARARGFLETALRSDDPRILPFAQATLAWLEFAEDNRERGLELVESAIRSGHPQAGNYALIARALLAEQDGDLDAVTADLRVVADAGDPEHSPWAMELLGDVLVRLEDFSGAENAYRRAVATGHPTWSEIAKVDLAWLLSDGSGPLTQEAIALLEGVAEGGHPIQRLIASGALGVLLGSRGDIDAARVAYQRVIDAENPDLALQAKVGLAGLLRESQRPADRAHADVLLDEVARAGDSEHSPWAADILGDVLYAEGDVEGARVSYQEAIDSGHPRWSPIARIDLAVLLADADGDLDAAVEHLDIAIAARDADVVASAHLTGGFVRLVQHRVDDARAEFALAAGSSSAHVDVRARLALADLATQEGDLVEASTQLGELLETAGSDIAGDLPPDTDPARTFLQQCDLLVDAGEIDAAAELLDNTLDALGQPDRGADPDFLVSLRAVLGRAVFLQQDYARARALLTEALAAITAGHSGDPPAEPAVRRFLASSLARLDEFDEARRILDPLIRSYDREHRPAALNLLGMLEGLAADPMRARSRFAEALAAAEEVGDHETAEAAAASLAGLPDDLPSLPAPPAALPAAEVRLTPLVRVLLGEYASAVGETAEAAHWVATALAGRIDPGLRSRALLVRAVSASEAGDVDLARRTAAEIVAAGEAWAGRAEAVLTDCLLAGPEARSPD